MENKDLLISFLIVCLILAIYIIANFLRYYVYPLNYVPVRYDELTMRTGDLLFVLQKSSPHTFISGEIFSHVCIIVVLNNIPHVLELAYPYIYCTPFYRRALSAAEGQTFYIKSVNKNVNISDRDLQILVNKARDIKYNNNVIKYFLQSAITSGSYLIKNIDIKKEGICSTFVLWFLHKLNLLHDVDSIETPRIITWLATSYNKHHLPVRRIRFFDGTPNTSFADHINILTNDNPLQNVLNY
jgi:hypothetical protein